MQDTHRREQIIDAFTTLFDVLTEDTADSGYPIKAEVVQNRWAHWTQLSRQGALPALIVMPGDGGSTPNADAIGFIDEQFPVFVFGVLEEERTGDTLAKQYSDLHYSVGKILNGSRDLGVEGVIAEETGIRDWRVTAEDHYPFLIVRFRVIVVHRYYSTDNV